MKTRVAVVLAVVVVAAAAVLALVLLQLNGGGEVELAGAAKTVKPAGSAGETPAASPGAAESIGANEMSAVASPGAAGSISANEMSAVASLLAIATAQNTWHQNDLDGNGVLDYTPQYRNLHYQTNSSGKPVALIPRALADASGVAGLPYKGYRFGDMVVHWQMGLFDFRYQFGHSAWPVTYGVTGCHTFIINTGRLIRKRDLGPASTIMVIYPNTSYGWSTVSLVRSESGD